MFHNPPVEKDYGRFRWLFLLEISMLAVLTTARREVLVVSEAMNAATVPTATSM